MPNVHIQIGMGMYMSTVPKEARDIIHLRTGVIGC